MSAMQAGTQMVKLRGSSKGLVRFYFLDEHRSCIRWRPSRKNEKAKSEQAALGAGGAGGCLGGSGLPRGVGAGSCPGGERAATRQLGKSPGASGPDTGIWLALQFRGDLWASGAEGPGPVGLWGLRAHLGWSEEQKKGPSFSVAGSRPATNRERDLCGAHGGQGFSAAC